MNIKMASYFDIAYKGNENTLKAKLLYDNKVFDDIKYMKDSNELGLLQYSLFGNNLQFAIYLIKNNLAIESNNYMKYSDLHIIAKYFYRDPSLSLQVAKMLVENGADLNYTSFKYQRTPFYEFVALSATYYLDEMIDFLEYCIQKKPNIYCADIYGNTLKSYFNVNCKSVINKSNKINSYINNKKLDIYKNSYFDIVTYGTYETFILKLKKCKDEIDIIKNLKDENNVSLFSYAISARNYAIASFLLEQNIDLNVVSKTSGFNELHYIANRLNDDEALNIAFTILSRNVDLNLCDKVYKNSPFWYFCKFVLDNPYPKYLEFIKFCFSKHPDIDYINNENKSIRKLILSDFNTGISKMISDI